MHRHSFKSIVLAAAGTVLFLSSLVQNLYAVVGHDIRGIAQYSGGGYPSSLSFSAYITSRPLDVLTQSSSGCSYDAASGSWVVQCNSFTSAWAVGDVLHIEFNDGAGGTGSDDVTLTSNSYDDAGTTVLSSPVVNRQIMVKCTTGTGVVPQITVDGVSYSSPQTFTWAQGSIHTLSVSSPQSGGTGTQSVFYAWSDGGSQSHSYTVPSSDQTVVAIFMTQYQLSTAENPDAGGDISPAPPGGWYDAWSSVTLDATVASGYAWSGWTGDVTVMTKPKTITMDGPKSVTANFTVIPSTVQITLGSYPAGREFIVDGTAYSTTQVFTWAQGSIHTLSVSSPQSGGTGTQYVFYAWNDGGSQSHSYTVPSSNQTVTAYFKTQYKLSTAENPDAGGDMSPAPPGGWYDSGSSVTLDATVASGYTWSGWTGDISETTKPKTFTMTGPKSVTANFTVVSSTVQITIETYPSGKQFSVDGTVYSSSQVFSWIPGSTHTLSVESPQHVSGGSKWVLLNWTDGGAQTHDYTVPSSNQLVKAYFKCMYQLTTTESPDAGGDMTPAPPGGWYDSGASVTLDATVASGYAWSGWTGDVTDTTRSKTVTMGGPKTVTANFTVIPSTVQITLGSYPAGREFIVDGTAYSTTQVFTWAQGSI
ncbi:MAG TPA: hypothetical protein VGB38_05305, partial [bacterium]